jgi:uncharacterized protein (TIGR02145 family)
VLPQLRKCDRLRTLGIQKIIIFIFFRDGSFVNVRNRLCITLYSISTIIIVSISNTRAQETVTDADGNVYTIVSIGDQVWTAENLKTTKYNDGSPIPCITDKSEWSLYDDNKEPAYCWYANDTSNKATYGALYNWYVVNTGKLAPEGWHVSTDAEWIYLHNFLIDSGFNLDETEEDYLIAKSMASTTRWAWGAKNNPYSIGNNVSENNRSGFSALPGGFRLISGNFRNIGTTGRWWTATEYDPSKAWRYNLRYDSGNLNRGYYFKGCGFSVRLVRD